MSADNFTTLPHLNKRIKNLCNQRFGKLHVLGFAGQDAQQYIVWLCRCDCGNLPIVKGSSLIGGRKRSCGCLTTATHGQSGYNRTSEYRAWEAAKRRCQNPQSEDYPDYGGRSIEFRFTSYEEFFAHLGQKPAKHFTLNRIDNNGHYEIGNVEWATQPEQSRNKRNNHSITAFGKTQCLYDWEVEYQHTKNRIGNRLKLGWCVECAITLKRFEKCSHKSQLP